ncbi:MAG: hypothetical protein K0Q73_6209 [Paenibacillus sp.]|jgi:hypothetical protein|nr:hypothetical protein [Paenibacillus sp.]
MNNNDLELKLLYGAPIDLEHVGTIHNPSLRDIVTMGESLYNQYLSAILFHKSHIEGLNLEEAYTSFQILFNYCYHNEDFRDITLKAIQFFFKENAHLGHDDTDVFFYFGDISESRRINESNFDLIQDIIKKMNYIKTSKETDYNPANSKAQQMIDLIMNNKKNKPKPKETMNLHSIISGLAWKSNSHHLFNIFDLTIYQLYQGFSTMENIDHYYHTLVGIYSGNVNGKDINFAQLHWAKKSEND